MTKVCTDCGSRSTETLFPKIKRGSPKTEPLLCQDCIDERARVALRDPPPRKAIQTRASYRAALRRRQKAAQMDLVDQIVKPP